MDICKFIFVYWSNEWFYIHAAGDADVKQKSHAC